MPSLVFPLLDGRAFFASVALVLIAVGLCALTRRAVARVVAAALGVLGAGVYVVSAPPASMIEFVATVAVILLWLAVELLVGGRGRRLAVLFRVIVAGVLLAQVVLEIPYERRPMLPAQRFERLIVLGDSVSAPYGRDGSSVWPGRVGRQCQVEVVNLAIAGATVPTALARQLPGVDDGPGLVVEIGGNDMLYGLPSEQFASGLDTLLAGVSGPGRRVVMFELPTVPFGAVYPYVQRRLARKHHVTLIPRRYFVSVIRHPGATTDGVHLTAEGHRRMAEVVDDLLGPMLGKAD